MEYGLRQTKMRWFSITGQVLILVVMEYGLRQGYPDHLSVREQES